MILRSAALLSTAVFVLAGASTAAARPSAVKHTTVKVTAKDFSFTLSTKKVKHGKVTFAIKNAGKTTHDFEIDGHKSKAIGPGKTTSLTVMLKAGHYTYKCTIDSHAALGMKGKVDVT